MLPSPGRAAHFLLEDFLLTATPPTLVYPSLHSSVVPRPPFDPRLHSHPELFSKVIHPYNTPAFELLLRKHRLLDNYPDLIRYLKTGFPIGPMPLLLNTNILDNHQTAVLRPDIIDSYIADEVASGRFDGPFSQKEIESILRGPFQSSPLIVSIQPQAPGEPDKIRVCRHLSKSRKTIQSVNSLIKVSDFPTRFDTAARVAEVVSTFPFLLLSRDVLSSHPVQRTHILFERPHPECGPLPRSS